MKRQPHNILSPAEVEYIINLPQNKKVQGELRRAYNTGVHINKISLNEIETLDEFYNNCPPGHAVDHIIPLKGNLYTGRIHIENVQYLRKDINTNKSNKLDPEWVNSCDGPACKLDRNEWNLLKSETTQNFQYRVELELGENPTPPNFHIRPTALKAWHIGQWYILRY